MFIQRFRNVVGKVVRRIVARIYEMIGSHDGGYAPVHSAEKAQRHGGGLIARLLGEPGAQWFFKVKEHEVVQLAGFIPPPLLRSVSHQAGSDKDIGRGSMFACPADSGWKNAPAFRFQAFRINSVVLEDQVRVVASLYPRRLFAALDLPEAGDSGFLAGRGQNIS